MLQFLETLVAFGFTLTLYINCGEDFQKYGYICTDTYLMIITAISSWLFIICHWGTFDTNFDWFNLDDNQTSYYVNQRTVNNNVYYPTRETNIKDQMKELCSQMTVSSNIKKINVTKKYEEQVKGLLPLIKSNVTVTTHKVETEEKNKPTQSTVDSKSIDSLYVVDLTLDKLTTEDNKMIVALLNVLDRYFKNDEVEEIVNHIQHVEYNKDRTIVYYTTLEHISLETLLNRDCLTYEMRKLSGKSWPHELKFMPIRKPTIASIYKSMAWKNV